MESAPMSTETETLRDRFAMAALTGMLASETKNSKCHACITRRKRPAGHTRWQTPC